MPLMTTDWASDIAAGWHDGVNDSVSCDSGLLSSTSTTQLLSGTANGKAASMHTIYITIPHCTNYQQACDMCTHTHEWMNMYSHTHTHMNEHIYTHTLCFCSNNLLCSHHGFSWIPKALSRKILPQLTSLHGGYRLWPGWKCQFNQGSTYHFSEVNKWQLNCTKIINV